MSRLHPACSTRHSFLTWVRARGHRQNQWGWHLRHRSTIHQWLDGHSKVTSSPEPNRPSGPADDTTKP